MTRSYFRCGDPKTPENTYTDATHPKGTCLTCRRKNRHNGGRVPAERRYKPQPFRELPIARAALPDAAGRSYELAGRRAAV